MYLEKREASSKSFSGQDPYLSWENFIYDCDCVVNIFHLVGDHIS